MIGRTDSIGLALGDDELGDLALMSKSQSYNQDEIKNAHMFISVDENTLKPMLNSNNLGVMSKSEGSHISNQSAYS